MVFGQRRKVFKLKFFYLHRGHRYCRLIGAVSVFLLLWLLNFNHHFLFSSIKKLIFLVNLSMSYVIKGVGALLIKRFSWLSLDYGSELLNITFLEVVLNQLKLWFSFIVFFLLINDQSVSVFKGILCSAVKLPHDLGPFLWALVFLNAF